MYRPDINNLGRSMIEMLGVLAIVGVLSVGGIVGFGKAMKTYQLTKAATEYAGFIRDLMQFRDALVKEARRNGGYAGVTSFVVESGILPKNWEYKGSSIIDSTFHETSVTATDKGVTVNYSLRNVGRWKGNIEEYCRLLFTYVVLPYRDVFRSVWIHRYGEGEGTGQVGSFSGTHYCTKGRACLSNVTVVEIQKFCQTCQDYEHCTLVLGFE